MTRFRIAVSIIAAAGGLLAQAAPAQSLMGKDGLADRVGIRDAGLVGGEPGVAAWFVDATTPAGFGDGEDGIDASATFGLMTDVHLLGDVNGDGLVDKVVVRPDPGGGWLNWFTDYSTPTTFGDGVADRVEAFGGTNMFPTAVVDMNGDGVDEYVASFSGPGWTDWWWKGGPGGGTSFGGPGVTPMMIDLDGNGVADRVIDMGGGVSDPNWVSDNGPPPPGGGFGDSAVDWGPSSYGPAGAVTLVGDVDGDGHGDRIVVLPGTNPGDPWSWQADLSSATAFGDGVSDVFQIGPLGGEESGDVPLIADVVRWQAPAATFRLLSIDRSGPDGIRLAWDPQAPASYFVEWAPAPDGPWTPLAGPLDMEEYVDGGVADARRFYRVEWQEELPPQTILANDFEDGPGEWSPSGLETDNWEWGVPEPYVADGETNGPPAAASGTNVWATGLNTPYSLGGFGGDEVAALLSPLLDLRGFSQITLTFQSWVDVENTFDFARLEVRDADSGALLGTIFDHTGPDPVWRQLEFDLSPYAGMQIRLRFVIVSDDVISYYGWAIDDLIVESP